MKNIILLIILFSSIFNAQTINDLKYQTIKTPNVNINSKNYPFEIESRAKKNVGLAIIYSLLLPGMGELYSGNYESGKYFTIADGVLWGTYAGFNIYGNNKKENYIAYAKANAGINLEGKESDFIANVGIYISSSEYNRIQELNRNFDKTYNQPNQQWNWQSNDFRKEFRDLWSSSESAFNNLRFIAGALVLNRIISAINAVRLVSAYNKNLSKDLSWNIYFKVENQPILPQTISFNFITKF